MQSGRDPTLESRVGQLAAPAVLLALPALVQAPLFDRMIVPMDEGHLAAAADRMLDGKRLYADIHTGIFPGIYLVTSGLFALFGRDLIVTRLAAALVNAVTVLALWSAARRVVAPRWALLPPLLHLALVAFAFPVMSMFNYSTLSLCLGLVALVFLLRYLERGRAIDGIWLGLSVAAAALTKQNFGALIFVALCLGLAIGRRESALADRDPIRALLPIGLAGASLTALVVIGFALQGALPALIDKTIVSLAGSQMRDFDNPIPPLFGPHPDDPRFVFLYSPPVVFDALVHGEPFLGLKVTAGLRTAATRLSYGLPIVALLGGIALLWRTRRQPPGPRRAATRAVVLFAVLFSPGIFPSAIWSHLAFVLPPIGLLVALLAERVDGRLRAARAAGPIIAWRVALALVALALLATTAEGVRGVVDRNPHPLELDRAHLRVSPRDRDLYRGAVAFVHACAAPQEPILALPDIPVIWFLTDRDNPSPYDLTIPGRVDGGLIVRRMRASGVRCVVMNPRMYPEFPPFKQLFPRLARALERDFRGARMIVGGDTRWLGLVRRDAPGLGTTR